MATTPGQRFVRRHDAARTTTSNTTAADITYDTAVISEGGYSWGSPEVTVDEAGLYLTIFDIGQVDLASTRACGTLVPSVNTSDQTRFRATHRYTRNSDSSLQGASIGMCILDLSASDDVKVRNPGSLTPTDAIGSYATNASYGGGLQLIRLPAENFTHVERTSDSTGEVGTSNINATRPWIDSSGTWNDITYNSELNDDDGLYPGTGADLTLAADTKYLIVWGVNIWSSDSSRHTDVVRLQIDGNNVQSGSGYQRNSASQGPPICGMYLHETGGSSETLTLQATHESEGGDAGTPEVADAYLQVLELPSSAEWIHVDNSTTDSLTTALASTTTWYDTPLSSTFRADGDSNLSLDSGNDAVQNDSGGTLPILAIGWHRWDRDAGTSGSRKNPWTQWDNGGAAVGYGVAGAFGRGQQSGDDTWQVHYCSAATMDLANAADLSFQAQDEAIANNADMGIYASTSRYFLGVQVLNLETLDAGGATQTASGTITAPTITASGTAQIVKKATAAVTIAAVTAAAAAIIWPTVYLNTTESKSGADIMTVTDVDPDGTEITFTDPAGGKTGSLYLGVENARDDIAWIGVTVNGGDVTASGTPSIATITSAATVELRHSASGTPSLEVITAAATTSLSRGSEGTPTLDAITASGQAQIVKLASGAPAITEITASGTATVAARVASGTPSIDALTAAATVELRHTVTATPSIEALTASGTANVEDTWFASGTPVLDALTASGQAQIVKLASGTPSVPEITASGSALVTHYVNAAVSIEVITASGITVLSGTVLATGSPVLAELTASGTADVIYTADGTPSVPEITASGVAGVTHYANGTPTAPTITASGVAKIAQLVTGAVSIDSPTASGGAFLWPKVYLNTTATKAGADIMTVTAANSAGTSATFTDPAGGKTGSLWLGVENQANDDIAWIGVTVTTTTKIVNGTPETPEITAAGAVTLTRTVTGTPSIETITASGATTVPGTQIASGTPVLPEIIASGVALVNGGAVALPADEGIRSGGWAARNAYDSYLQRKRDRERRRKEALEAIRELDGVDREIADILQKDIARESRDEEIAEFRDIVAAQTLSLVKQELPGELVNAFTNAYMQQTFSALEAFERQVERYIEDEEFLLLALMILR